MRNHDEYNPKMILKVYTRNQPQTDGVYMELHDVRSDGHGNFVEGAGRPLTLNAYKKLFSLSGMTNESQLIPDFNSPILDPRILCYEAKPPRRFICWYEKAQKKQFKLMGGKKAGYYIWMPATLYYVKNDVLNIYALRTNRRPVSSTWLYQMPLPNLKSQSTFCWGNVDTEKRIENRSVDDEMRAWEEMVWNSGFDSYNIHGYKDIYESLSKSGKRFPKKELKQTRLTIKDMLAL